MSQDWLIDEVRPLSGEDLAEIDRETPGLVQGVSRGEAVAPRLAVRLRRVVCYDVQKLIGSADIRLDAVVVHGGATKDNPDSTYQPQTMRWPDIRDGQDLPMDPDSGVIIFNGSPLHFLDLYIMVSRDRKNSDNLATLLHRELSSEEGKGAVSALLALTIATPTAAAVAGAVAAAGILGDLAYRVVKSVSPRSIGMYRGSFLQFRDSFGVGRHPADSIFRHNDLGFWYETVLDEA